MSFEDINFSDDQRLVDSKKKLVKRLKLAWYNRNNSDSDLLSYQGILSYFLMPLLL